MANESGSMTGGRRVDDIETPNARDCDNTAAGSVDDDTADDAVRWLNSSQGRRQRRQRNPSTGRPTTVFGCRRNLRPTLSRPAVAPAAAD